MAKAKSKKKSTTDWKQIASATKQVASVAALIVLAVAMFFGIDRLRDHAGAQLQLASNQMELVFEFDWPALDGSTGRAGETWLAEEDQIELIRVASRAIEHDSPLRVEPLGVISARLGKTGWFSDNPTVQRLSPGRFRVSGDWRVPAAAVRWEGKDRVLSADGYPMQPLYLAGRSGYPVILGISESPVVIGSDAFQVPWLDNRIPIALDLLAVLREGNLLEEISAVDVEPFYAEGVLEIIMSQGTRIVWGAPVDQWKAGEPSVQEKLDRIRGLEPELQKADAAGMTIEIHRARVEIDRSHGALNRGGD